MPTNEEILRELESIKERGGNVEPFLKKWAHLLYPVLEMVPIPSGSYQMGSEKGQYEEEPVHNVSLSAFRMAKYPVTFKQWQEVKGWGEQNGYQFVNEGRQGAGSKTDETHPITSISWYDAVLWCNALSEKEGGIPCYYTDLSKKKIYRNGENYLENDMVNWKTDGYRLPTEAEWEYACRAGTRTEYSFGDSINHNQANYDAKENGTTPVGKHGPNNWGLYDMHGNVFEWCWDQHKPSYYEKSPANNPKGPIEGVGRVIRGGSWPHAASLVRSASRYSINPNLAYFGAGFRPVCKSDQCKNIGE